MHIERSQTLCGYPIFEIRRLFKHACYGSYHEVWSARRVMQIPEDEAQRLLMELAKEGYLESGLGHNGMPIYSLTMKGCALRIASATKQIHRATADRLIEGLLERVVILNHSSEFLMQVDKVVLFGSYLSDAERLSDVDVALAWSRKPEYRNERSWQEAVNDRIRIAIQNGRKFYDDWDELDWPNAECRLFIKNGHRCLSLHSTNDGIFDLPTTKTKVIFEVSASQQVA